MLQNYPKYRVFNRLITKAPCQRHRPTNCGKLEFCNTLVCECMYSAGDLCNLLITDCEADAPGCIPTFAGLVLRVGFSFAGWRMHQGASLRLVVRHYITNGHGIKSRGRAVSAAPERLFQRSESADDYLGDFVALTADVETISRILNADAVEVVILCGYFFLED